VLLALAALAVAALVAGVGSASAAKTQTLRISADAHGAMKFNTKHLSAHAGRVTIVMTNPKTSGMEHAVAISGHGVHASGKIVGPGGSSKATATLKRGTYTFFCPVPGHAAAGMKGTITVR